MAAATPTAAAPAPTATAPARPPPAARPVTLVTWDIDGTLLRATGDRANALHRASFEAAWLAVYGARVDLASLPHQGSTDPLILIKGAVAAGLAAGAGEVMGGASHVMGGDAAAAPAPAPPPPPVPPTAVRGSPLDAMVRAMLAHFQAHEHTVGDGLELLPGAEDLLRALAGRDDVLVGLVTGNLRPIAAAKVSALGVRHLFHDSEDGGCGGGRAAAGGGGHAGGGPGPPPAPPPLLLGGFGSDHCSGGFEEPAADRAELIRVAARRAAALAGLLPAGAAAGAPPPPSCLRVAHLGDTPYDVAAALAAGATPVGVATGVHSRAELEAAGGPGVVVLEDLRDTEAALAALGLGRSSRGGGA